MTNHNDWSWKEDVKPYKKPTKLTNKKKRKKKKQARKKHLIHDSLSSEFYTSPEWRKLRYRVLRKYKAECVCCGRSKKDHGIVVHVDHIKPRSKHPKLSLEFKNMQVLCEDCNLGKSNIDDTDWRTVDNIVDKKLDVELLINNKGEYDV